MSKLEKRLFDNDPYLDKITAKVESCEKIKEGYSLILDRTIFYPRGGGQPCEGGTINGMNVLDAYDEGGEILHIVEQPIEAGTEVSLEINMKNRRANMCHHLAQHILSAIMTYEFDNDTVSAHMEDGYGHIELPRKMTPQELRDLEIRAREVIAADYPVRTYYITPEEAQKVKYRGKITPHDMIRFVEIEGFDINACGGCHCRSTGELRHIVITGTKDVRGLFRIYFKAGADAEAELENRTLYLMSAQQSLGIEWSHELPEAAESTAKALMGAKATLEAYHNRIETLYYNYFLSISEDIGGRPFITDFINDYYDTNTLRSVASRLVKEKKATVVLCACDEQEGSLIFMRAKGPKEPDLGAYVKKLMADHGGRGGGSPVLAQGMFPTFTDAAHEAVLKAFEDIRNDAVNAAN
ncbi:MAG: hypothetical protein IIW34_01440 [Clostridia bacterium]|nr:hypothetical protein [Clostridia bacterium]MBQ5812797.1 hypothetical protein [Clostridia bacterium]